MPQVQGRVLYTGGSPNTFLTQYTESFPRWPPDGSKTTPSEWASGGPSLAYGGVYRRVVVGWTGTDQLHHLNMAMVAM